MDLFCCGMYRSCSTWQYDVALEVLKFARWGDRPVQVASMGYSTGPEYSKIAKARRYPGNIRVFKGHEGHPSYTNAIFRGKALALYAHRDMRDVIFSLMHKRNQSFQEIVRTGMIHQILVNDRFWRLHPQTLVQRYDEIMANPAGAVTEIAEYLHVELPGGEAARIAEAYSKEANLERATGLKNRLAAQGVDLSDVENSQVYDASTLLHWNHIRPDSTSWRQTATPSQRLVMQNMLRDWLLENDYAPDNFADLEQADSASAKNWRVDAAQGLLRCHSREFSSRHHRWSQPLKRFLGLGHEETRSKAHS